MPVGMAFDLDARLSSIPVWRMRRLHFCVILSLLFLHEPPQFLVVWISIFELGSKISDWSNKQSGVRVLGLGLGSGSGSGAG
jgi:hypothetical protein